MRDYELVFIIAPVVADDEIETFVEKVTNWIQVDGGAVTKVDLWGRRELAYPIQKFTEGTYVLLNLQVEPSALAELERNIKLDTSIVRYLLVRAEQ